MESVVHNEAQILDGKLLAVKGTGAMIRLDHAFSSFAGDVIGELACGDSPEMLAGDDFTPDW